MAQLKVVVSTGSARRKMSAPDLDQAAERARAIFDERGITGWSLFASGNVMSWLEGPANLLDAAVDAATGEWQKDLTVLLADRTLDGDRFFAEWNMAADVRGAGAQLVGSTGRWTDLLLEPGPLLASAAPFRLLSTFWVENVEATTLPMKYQGRTTKW